MNQTDKAIEEITRALNAGSVANADITSSNSGVNGIDLLAAANVVTLKTPFADIIPREPSGATGPAALYNVIKGGVSGDTTGYTEEGKRGGQATFAGAQSGAYYKTLSVEIAVTDEARYASEGQIDLLSAATTRALIEAKRIQERRFLTGRASIASDAFAAGRLTTTADGASVSATPTPTVVAAASGELQRIGDPTAPGKFWIRTAPHRSVTPPPGSLRPPFEPACYDQTGKLIWRDDILASSRIFTICAAISGLIAAALFAMGLLHRSKREILGSG